MKKLAIVLGLALLTAAPSWASSIGVGVAHWDTQDAAEDQGFGIKVAFSMSEAQSDFAGPAATAGLMLNW